MTKLLKNEVYGLRCKKCTDTIYSRHRHDFRYCKCKAIAIDGGRDYIRMVGESNDMEPIVINTETNNFYIPEDDSWDIYIRDVLCYNE